MSRFACDCTRVKCETDKTNIASLYATPAGNRRVSRKDILVAHIVEDNISGGR